MTCSGPPSKLKFEILQFVKYFIGGSSPPPLPPIEFGQSSAQITKTCFLRGPVTIADRDDCATGMLALFGRLWQNLTFGGSAARKSQVRVFVAVLLEVIFDCLRIGDRLFLGSGRPRGPFQEVGGFAPHLLEGLPGPRGPPRPPKMADLRSIKNKKTSS